MRVGVTLVLSLGFWVAAAAVADAQDVSAPARPRGLTITPNALQDPGRPMRIALQAGIKQPLWLLVLRDCARDGSTPDVRARPGCVNPLRKKGVQTDDSGAYNGELVLDGRDGEPALPPNETLVLRAAAVESGEHQYQDVVFGIGGQRCSLWSGVLGSFGLGKCTLGMDRVFNPVRSPGEERPAVTLRVQRVDPRQDPPVPMPVAGTDGATGVAWEGPQALLVTLQTSTQAGLYRIDLRTGAAKQIVAAKPGRTLTAPLALGHGGIAVIEELTPSGAAAPVVSLLLVQGTAEAKRWPLSRTVHQLLAVDGKRHKVLACSRATGEAEVFTIDWQTGTEVSLVDNALLAEAQRAASDGAIALAYPDAANHDGWDLVLLDRQGQLLHGVALGPGHDLMPAWSPSGAELVYLSQVPAERSSR